MSISIVLPTLHGMGWNAADRRERWNPKRCGELSEAAFLLKATEQGFLVAKPWGDSERYDFIVDSGTRLWRPTEVNRRAPEPRISRQHDAQNIWKGHNRV
jgi:PD-(D/E)XK nuclease superfamily protein